MLLSRAYTRCLAILVYCSVKYWTWFCYLIGIAVHTLSDSLRIFFSTLEIGLKKIRNSLPNSLDRRKPYSERISYGLKNVRMRVDGAYV